MLLLAVFVLPQFAVSQTDVSTFEELELDSTGYWNGSDDAGGFTSGNAYFINHYNHDWNSWTGFAYSNMTDTVTAGYSNQYSAYAGIGADSSNNYCVAYNSGNDTVTLTTSTTVSGAYLTNNTYAGLSMRDGDAYSKKFGGADGNDPDWFKLSIFGIDDNNNNTDTIEFYLSDFRFADNDSDYIVKDWTWADFTSLGDVKKIVFFLSSTDNGDWGMNTPAYFCLDNLNGSFTNAYTVTFTVTDGTSPIEGATVTLAGYEEQTTDSTGTAIFDSIAIENNIAYTVNASGYLEATGTISVVNVPVSVNITMITVGIDELSNNRLNIYPNPSTGIFYIKPERVLDNTQLFIRDINGKLILSQKFNSDNNKVDISDSPAGIYFIQMFTDNKVVTKKIIKQ